MKKMPKTAKRVAQFIKENVPRPSLPTDCHGVLGWQIASMTRACPMGLLPCAIMHYQHPFSEFIGAYTPSNKTHFTEGDYPGTEKEIGVFYRWWDSIEVEDAKKAVDAIWGKK